MKGFVVLVCVVFCGLTECNDEFPITPCQNEDTACLKASSQAVLPSLAAGVPSMGIDVMDPMRLDRIKTVQAGLEMDFRNTIVKGMRHCRVLNLRRRTHQTDIDIMCSVTLVGDYTLGGRLLIMPIEGDGRFHIKIRDIVIKVHMPLGEKTRDGEKYWVVKKWTFSSDVKTRAHYKFKHLFNGNKQLSDAIHEFANKNWREIFQEVAPPIVKAIVSKVVVESSKLFDFIPINKLVIQ